MSFFINPKLLPANLAYLMSKRKGLNPTSLSAATGVPQPTIQRVLKGKSKEPRASTVDPIANYFGIPAHFLLCVDLEAADAEPGGPEAAYAEKVKKDLATFEEMERTLSNVKPSIPPPSPTAPGSMTVSSLLDRLKSVFSELPEVLRHANSDLVVQYLDTPDPDIAKKLAEAIEKLTDKDA